MNQWIDENVKSLKSQPQKVGVLGVLVLLLATLIGRAVFTGGAHPAAAVAEIFTPENSDADKPVIASKPIQNLSSRALLAWSEQPSAPVSRNVFAINVDYFAADGSKTNTQPQTEDGFWPQLEKSMALAADQTNKRENLIANLKDQARTLELRSIAMGAVPKAMINGDMVGEGDLVGTFRVSKIEARRVILERDGVRLAIELN